MADHYYSQKPVSHHEYQEFQTVLRGVELKFLTDAGVFSKDRVDTGTKLLIKALPVEQTMDTILDLGCGYGPIGLTLAKLMPQATVYMGDVNERAVELASRNVALNGVPNVVLRVGEGLTPFSDLRFDMIVTNPPIRAGKKVIYAMVEDAHMILKPGGWLVAVILTRHGAKSLAEKMKEVFGNNVEWEKGSGYRVLASKRTVTHLDFY